MVGLEMVDALGVLNAPVDARWRRSNSSCSLGGSRGGAGPVAKAGLMEEVEKKCRRGRRNLGGRRRGILDFGMRYGSVVMNSGDLQDY